ncbi:tail fiber assembly protein [Salmonella enterica]
MNNIKNFTRYTPESDEKKELEKNINAIFLVSEDGQDWYDCQVNFSVSTFKVMYDANGIVRAITKDVSNLYPENRSVAEVNILPDGAAIDGNWMYENGCVIPRTLTHIELIQQLENEKTRLLSHAEKNISPLKDAVELGIATNEENVKYAEWRNYRVLVNRVDISDPEKVSWPNLPE